MRHTLDTIMGWKIVDVVTVGWGWLVMVLDGHIVQYRTNGERHEATAPYSQYPDRIDPAHLARLAAKADQEVKEAVTCMH
jgi:hypothetical protein